MLLSRSFWSQQLPWLILTLVLGGSLTGWFVFERLQRNDWPGGSTWVGMTLGIVGGVLILFEFFLWPRKKMRRYRLGRVKHWMAGHIWLGLLTLPLLIFHSGFRLGGSLSTLLTVLLVIVVLSGVWGLVLQQILPKRMLVQVQGETIHSQIPRINALTLQEVGRMVDTTCGGTSEASGFRVETDSFDEVDGTPSVDDTSHVVIGAVRTVGRIQGTVVQTSAPLTQVPDSDALRDFFDHEVVPYLKRGKESKSSLQWSHRAEAMFRDLRTRLDPKTNPTVDALEAACEQRRQHDLQLKLHQWLHNWLLVHLPLSIALVLLMFVHIYVALRFW